MKFPSTLFYAQDAIYEIDRVNLQFRIAPKQGRPRSAPYDGEWHDYDDCRGGELGQSLVIVLSNQGKFCKTIWTSPITRVEVT